MKIYFDKDDIETIVNKVSDKLKHRRLGKIVSFNTSNKNLSVTIKKMGTSCLEFTNTAKDNSIIWELHNEKIALSHRAFKNEVIMKLKEIVHELGGRLEI